MVDGGRKPKYRAKFYAIDCGSYNNLESTHVLRVTIYSVGPSTIYSIGHGTVELQSLFKLHSALDNLWQYPS